MTYGQTLIGYVVVALDGAALTFVAFGMRAQGPLKRYFVWYSRVMLAWLFVMTVIAAGWPPYHEHYTPGFDAPTHELIAMHLAIVVTAVLTWRWRRSQPPPARVPIDWAQYVVWTGVLLFVSYAFGKAFGDAPFPAGGQHAALPHALNMMIFFLVGFTMSQLTTWALIRCLQKALRDDWLIAEGSPHRRTYIFLLAGAPIALLIIPSLMNGGAMLGGVLLQLVFLIVLWRYTSSLPTSIVTFGWHLLLRRLRTLGRKRPADPAATPT